MIKDIKPEDLIATEDEIFTEDINYLQKLASSEEFRQCFFPILMTVTMRQIAGFKDWLEMLYMYGFELGYKVAKRESEIEKLEKINENL